MSLPTASTACLKYPVICSSVRKCGGGAIITPAAPASMDARASELIAANPGAETPTMICMFFARFTKRLAQDAQHGHAVTADLGVEVGQPVDGFVIDAAVIVERRRRDREGACGLMGEFCHLCLYPILWPSFRGARSANPESRYSPMCHRTSAFDAAHRPGMTLDQNRRAPILISSSEKKIS